jgi:putative chitinase
MNERDIIEAREHLAKVDAFLLALFKALRPVVVTPVLPAADVGLQDPGEFYDYIRGEVGELFPIMRSSQLEGMQRLLKAGAGKLPAGWMAYLLATVYHETAKTMQPVREGLNVSDAWRKKNLRYYPWYGRGDIQLTWEYNYDKAGKFIGVDLIADPDKALDPGNSARIAVEGMLEGWFTGKKLRDYIPADPTRQHFVNARRIINGTDKAELIAGYAVEFYKGLLKGDWA